MCHRSVCYAWGKQKRSTERSLGGDEGRLYGEDNIRGEF